MKFRIIVLMAAVLVLSVSGAWAGHGKCSHGQVLLNQSLMNIKNDCKMCGEKKSCDMPDKKMCKKDKKSCDMKDKKMCKKDKKSCPMKSGASEEMSEGEKSGDESKGGCCPSSK